MDIIIDFIKSDMGVGIAWICSVCGTVWGVLKSAENKRLKIEISNINANNDNSNNDITQSGEKNVYTKNNSGGMKINM